MKQYKDLLRHVMDEGQIKQCRQGVPTLSTFNYNYEHDLRDGFPILTGKKIFWKSVVIENLWFLGRSRKIDFLHKHGVKFWDQWADEKGNLPQAYGEFWRDFPNYQIGGEFPDEIECDIGFDQFDAILGELASNPNSRRLVLTNWYPPSAWRSKLPPCHLLAIFNVQYEHNGNHRLCLHMTQRSCDVPVGVPFNIAGYGFILQLVSHLSGIEPGIFGHTLVDAHIYMNQMDGVEEYMKRSISPLPTLKISDRIKSMKDLDELIEDGTTKEIMGCFVLEGYNPQPYIPIEVLV